MTKDKREWDKLKRLINQHTKAAIADSWKGNNELKSYSEIERRYEIASKKLAEHIDFLKNQCETS
jgi:hypothetical protein